jgi:hypothetical protein
MLSLKTKTAMASGFVFRIELWMLGFRFKNFILNVEPKSALYPVPVPDLPHEYLVPIQLP